MESDLKRIEALFTAALAQPEAERVSFVRAQAGTDTALATSVERLLRADAQAGPFLEKPPVVATGADSAPSDEGPGVLIGRYRLVKKIGEGGGGSVFLAEQEEPVTRRVALKVIKRGMDTRAVVARFEAERQALALMDHPNIARVFDAGETERGRPFFVMEFVEGVPITRYCDRAKLAPDARLEIFRQVCSAIQHAHQKGIIHRDIKPSNILVTEADGRPVPKVIDFGIAKATEARLTEATLITEFTQLVGTPAYMSPEQMEFGQGDIDTRSDVYALGVVLYELLTGCPPFETQELLRAGLDAMRRRIRDEEPARPSARLDTLERNTQQAVAESRSTEPVRLAHLLRGELDWIVMRCLEKDRARRYPTANALAEDVRRYLQNEPVSAAAPSRFYVWRKFARRNRTGVAVAAGFASFLIVAAIGGALLAARATEAERLAEERLRVETTARATAERERTRAAAAEKKAKDEAARASAINDFFQTDIIGQAAPGSQTDRNLTVRAALDAAAKHVDSRFAQQPELEVGLRYSLGGAYNALGEYKSAIEQLERALSLSEKVLGPDDIQTTNVRANLCGALVSQGRYADAEKIAPVVLAARIRQLGPDDKLTTEAKHMLSTIYLGEGRYAEAEANQREVIAAHEKNLGPNDHMTLHAMSTLSIALLNASKLDDAEKLLRLMIERYTANHEAETIDALYPLNSLAGVLRQRGNLTEAEALQRRIIEARRRLLGPEHPDTLTAINNLTVTLNEEGHHAEAAELIRGLLDARRKLLGPDHPQTLVTMNNLAFTERKLGHLDESDQIFVAVIEVARRTLGPSHPGTLQYSGNRVGLLLEKKDLTTAETAAREQVALRQKAMPDSWFTFADEGQLGRVLIGLGRYSEAEPLLIDAFNGLTKRDGQVPASQKVRFNEIRSALVELYMATNRPDDAAKWRPADQR